MFQLQFAAQWCSFSLILFSNTNNTDGTPGPDKYPLSRIAALGHRESIQKYVQLSFSGQHIVRLKSSANDWVSWHDHRMFIIIPPTISSLLFCGNLLEVLKAVSHYSTWSSVTRFTRHSEQQCITNSRGLTQYTLQSVTSPVWSHGLSGWTLDTLSWANVTLLVCWHLAPAGKDRWQAKLVPKLGGWFRRLIIQLAGAGWHLSVLFKKEHKSNALS